MTTPPPPRPVRGIGLAIAAVGFAGLVAIPAAPAVGQVYPSSVVGTEFDIIRTTDPTTFKSLAGGEVARREMPDKTGDAALVQPAYAFTAGYADGHEIDIAVDRDFADRAAAKKEAERYATRLGRLPGVLRRGVKRVVVHKGEPDATAFSDIGLVVVYSANASKRIATNDLEETLFHESVHATWDKTHAGSPGWKRAQAADGGFLTRYAQRLPGREDLAETALLAFAVLEHPERIPEADREKIRQAVPARIAFVGELLEKAKAAEAAKAAESEDG